MNANGFTLDLNTLALVFVVLLLLWSVRTLLVYFFGANGPLMNNAWARLEANKKPEELIPAAERDVAVKRFWGLVAGLILVWFLYYADSEAFIRLAGAAWSVITTVAQWLAQEFRQFAAQLLS